MSRTDIAYCAIPVPGPSHAPRAASLRQGTSGGFALAKSKSDTTEQKVAIAWSGNAACCSALDLHAVA
eukprot:1677739-Rhodomonas_salina.4